MPTVQLTVPKNDLNRSEKTKFIEHLTDSVAQFYDEEKDEQIKEFVNVQIRETTEGGYAVGGEIIG
ncbi:hypothetical protein NC796_21605 [Aliifodinibius sp. S!AR15-10]|uniref:tautomerase family protein n=1 Tax=Aliifodinibius sp. S!AR15-10 TaxID=2950437 RepID=UPI0028552339|nr:hypothetical protein [Aliifodinibius sp. S!AR15-10]MDR8393765.1 hypothetical protein [Aliifodinibius sp. S!AR15-10]